MLLVGLLSLCACGQNTENRETLIAEQTAAEIMQELETRTVTTGMTDYEKLELERYLQNKVFHSIIAGEYGTDKE